ncbi:galactose mutarotase [Thalassomonas viridans]|uniref:Aldose 1-epimerase n=1 Tax=Thalassomonas viridans TaxID=137584 RepID=A0AAE9Z8Q7_9GAMM|nr:aldose epimerase family protein [Thalassomonas viridans]WDE08831.1 galactose mutarotase [Thalassomonas viridans]
MREIKGYRLANAQGMQVQLLDFGARVASISLPVKGKQTEMTLGYPHLEDYRHDPYYLGASVGRVCNRIANGRFSLNGRVYQLSRNSRGHCLHGGEAGFSSRFWQLDQASLTSSFARFKLRSEDGDQGFPGTLLASVSYFLDDDNRLQIHFHATCDQDIPVNFCNHCYFHLGEASIDGLSLQIDATDYLPATAELIPTCEVKPVAASDFCFQQSALLGQRIKQASAPGITDFKGFDHCYWLSGVNRETPVARLTGQTSGVSLSVYSDQPGLQLYSGQHLASPFTSYRAVCLEVQDFPDAINNRLSASPVLPAGEEYRRYVCYQFSQSAEPA